MRRLLSMVAVLLTIRCASGRNAGARIDAIIAAHPQATIAVAFDDLDGESFMRNEREVFHAASTMKVPVMLAIFEAAARRELDLTEPIAVRNEFASIVDGSPYSLDPDEDSDPALYEQIGRQAPVEELVRRMIVRSSNLATNLVIELIGAPRVMELMRRIGATDIRVLRGVEDGKAYEAGLNNTTTARDLMIIFRTIAEGRAVSAAASQKMLDILLAQELNDGIPAGLPRTVRVAHKTGSITKIAHDAGIVIAPDGRRYILVVLTRGFEKTSDAEAVIAAISRAVWEAR